MSAIDYEHLSREQLVERLRALEYSAEHLSGILRAVPIGIGVVAERVFLEINEAMVAMTGYGRDELLGQSARMLYPTQADFDFVGTEKYGQIRERGIGSVVTRWRRKDGGLLDVVLRSVPIRLGDPSSGFVFTAMDISEQKRAEEALRESEQRYRTLVEHLPAVVYLAALDANSTTLYLSPQSARIFGYTQQDVEANPRFWDQAICSDDRERVMAAVAACQRDGTPLSIEYCLHNKDGRLLWLRDEAAIVTVGKERCLQGVMLDISDLKHAEAALRESESFYRQTLESIPGMVFTTRPDGYCDYQSQQWVDYTGVPMVEHLGDGWNKLQHPDDRPRSYAAWQAAIEGIAPYDIEYRVRRHDGVYEWFQVVGRPIRDSAGNIVRWFGVAVNIERIKRAEETMARQRDTLVREVHHRIKNHLQGITGLLRNRAVARPEIAAVLGEAIGQINTVAQVYGLQGRGDVERVRLCDLLQMAAEGALVPVTVDCRPSVPCCAVPLAPEEAVPIALVVNELIVNAVKHPDPPDPARLVRVTVDTDADGVTVMIRNAPARLPADFDFASGKSCGTGLELVRALLPRAGAALAFRQEGDAVVTTLRLEPPVVRLAVS